MAKTVFFHFDLHIVPTVLNGINAYYQETVITSKKVLLKQYFLLFITFSTYFEASSNFEFEAILIFYVIFSQCKWVSGVDTYEAEIAANSIIWELCAKKSAECLNLCSSFITISSWHHFLKHFLVCDFALCTTVKLRASKRTNYISSHWIYVITVAEN